MSTRVTVRVRPASDDTGNIVQVDDTRIVKLIHPVSGKEHSTAFDNVFPSDCSQSQVYAQSAHPLVMPLLQGSGGCVFIYGPSGSGRNYTTFGPSKGDVSTQGILPRLIRELQTTAAQTPDTNLTIYASLVEVDDDAVRDLLRADGKALRVRQHPKWGVYIEDCCRVTVHAADDMFKLIELSEALQIQAQTDVMMLLRVANPRAHHVLSIYTEVADAMGQSSFGKADFVLMASSERVWQATKADGKAVSIVSKTFAAIAHRQPHIPYRDSRLTRLLQSTLATNMYCAFIGHICSNPSDHDETLNTITYLRSCKRIKQPQPKAKVVSVLNQVQDEVSAILASLRERNSAVQLIRNSISMASGVANKLQHPLNSSEPLSLDVALLQLRGGTQQPQVPANSAAAPASPEAEDEAEREQSAFIARLQLEQKNAVALYSAAMAEDPTGAADMLASIQLRAEQMKQANINLGLLKETRAKKRAEEQAAAAQAAATAAAAAQAKPPAPEPRNIPPVSLSIEKWLSDDIGNIQRDVEERIAADRIKMHATRVQHCSNAYCVKNAAEMAAEMARAVALSEVLSLKVDVLYTLMDRVYAVVNERVGQGKPEQDAGGVEIDSLYATFLKTQNAKLRQLLDWKITEAEEKQKGLQLLRKKIAEQHTFAQQQQYAQSSPQAQQAAAQSADASDPYETSPGKKGPSVKLPRVSQHFIKDVSPKVSPADRTTAAMAHHHRLTRSPSPPIRSSALQEQQSVARKPVNTRLQPLRPSASRSPSPTKPKIARGPSARSPVPGRGGSPTKLSPAVASALAQATVVAHSSSLSPAAGGGASGAKKPKKQVRMADPAAHESKPAPFRVTTPYREEPVYGQVFTTQSSSNITPRDGGAADVWTRPDTREDGEDSSAEESPDAQLITTSEMFVFSSDDLAMKTAQISGVVNELMIRPAVDSGGDGDMSVPSTAGSTATTDTSTSVAPPGDSAPQPPQQTGSRKSSPHVFARRPSSQDDEAQSLTAAVSTIAAAAPAAAVASPASARPPTHERTLADVRRQSQASAQAVHNRRTSNVSFQSTEAETTNSRPSSRPTSVKLPGEDSPVKPSAAKPPTPVSDDKRRFSDHSVVTRDAAVADTTQQVKMPYEHTLADSKVVADTKLVRQRSIKFAEVSADVVQPVAAAVVKEAVKTPKSALRKSSRDSVTANVAVVTAPDAVSVVPHKASQPADSLPATVTTVDAAAIDAASVPERRKSKPAVAVAPVPVTPEVVEAQADVPWLVPAAAAGVLPAPVISASVSSAVHSADHTATAVAESKSPKKVPVDSIKHSEEALPTTDVSAAKPAVEKKESAAKTSAAHVGAVVADAKLVDAQQPLKHADVTSHTKPSDVVAPSAVEGEAMTKAAKSAEVSSLADEADAKTVAVAEVQPVPVQPVSEGKEVEAPVATSAKPAKVKAAKAEAVTAITSTTEAVVLSTPLPAVTTPSVVAEAAHVFKSDAPSDPVQHPAAPKHSVTTIDATPSLESESAVVPAHMPTSAAVLASPDVVASHSQDSVPVVAAPASGHGITHDLAVKETPIAADKPLVETPATESKAGTKHEVAAVESGVAAEMSDSAVSGVDNAAAVVVADATSAQ
eukprot:TRINITY_DN882_c0_g1_i1.p1 TRINITY_DN882_c0_g1~~TRINITY_DN882_c0_g1_i1.p1  ORF type:complete len:1609 (+),score=443.11 TRINITY_DN882_c0_g1_i1:1433-6259(+)